MQRLARGYLYSEHRRATSRLAVGVLAIPDRVDPQRIGMLFGEADSIVTDSEALFTDLTLPLLDIAAAILGESVNRRRDVHGNVLGMVRMLAFASSEKTMRFKSPDPRGPGRW